jgi:hypothetical protein
MLISVAIMLGMTTIGGGLITMYLSRDPDQPETTCHVCHREAPLTREHIPPLQAFNDERRIWERFNPYPSREKAAEDPRKQVIRETWQHGFYVHALCAGCNSRLGGEVASEYVRFVRSLAEAPRLFDPISERRAVRVWADTLLLARQIAVMILSIEPVSFGRLHGAFRAFAEGEIRAVDPPFRVFGFLVPRRPEAGTISASQYRLDAFRGGYNALAGEISMFPFGLVYAFELEARYRPTDLADITHWFSTTAEPDRRGAWLHTYPKLTVLNSIHCSLGNPRFFPQIDFAFARP